MSPQEIFDKMYSNDWFSQWLGIELIEVKAGYCKLKMKVRREMLNGFGIAHGGISYSLADSALAFASNSQGTKSVSIETSIAHTEQIREGEEIFAEAIQVSISNKIARYKITIVNSKKETVALFNGTVYRTGKEWSHRY